MGGLMSNVTYHGVDPALGVDEVGIYDYSGPTVNLIFFSGKRASNVAITRFSRYMRQFTPCKAYFDVPRQEVEAFLEEVGKPLETKKIRGQKVL
jgi:hypothetical protein